MAKSRGETKAERELRDGAMTYPGATEEFPWGHRAIEVKGKAFVSEYGLGKSGWVSARFAPGEKVPVALLASWVEESYRAIAPKKLVAELDDAAPVRKTKKRPARAARR